MTLWIKWLHGYIIKCTWTENEYYRRYNIRPIKSNSSVLSFRWHFLNDKHTIEHQILTWLEANLGSLLLYHQHRCHQDITWIFVLLHPSHTLMQIFSLIVEFFRATVMLVTWWEISDVHGKIEFVANVSKLSPSPSNLVPNIGHKHL